jgi:Lipid A 3-O-deacylase (PagL)
MRLLALSLLALAFSSSFARGQSSQEELFSFRNSVSMAASYSDNSSHIILGRSNNRRLTELEATYSRRLRHTHSFDWYYDLEVRPVTFIQDPVSTFTVTIQFTGQPTSGSFVLQNGPIISRCQSAAVTTVINPGAPFPGETVTDTLTCGTRWTYAGGLSPLGQRFNFAPGHRFQPFAFANAGFLVSPRDLPVFNSSRFNFTFDFGAGLQLFRDHHHAWSIDYRIHHLSNAYIGNQNPGIDSQVVRLTYAFNP